MTKLLKDLVPTIFNQKNRWKFNLLNNWHAIVGNLHTKVHIEKIYDTILVLGVNDSCWMQELYLLSSVLIKTINEKLDRPRIKQVRFKKIGERTTVGEKKNVTQRRIKPRKIILTAIELKALKKIHDPQLSSALKDFLIRCYQERIQT